MSIVFSSNELINIAVGIERRGITFYDIMAKSTDDEMSRAVFHSLTNMEREHIRIFQDMLGDISMRSACRTRCCRAIRRSRTP